MKARAHDRSRSGQSQEDEKTSVTVRRSETGSRRRGIRRVGRVPSTHRHEPTQAPPTIQEIAQARLTWMSLRRAQATVDFYGFAYRRVQEYIADMHAEQLAHRWTPEVADRYATWMLGTGVKPATVRHYLDALLTLLRWAVKQRRLTSNPLDGYEPPAGRSSEVPGYSVEQISRMLAACPDDRLGRRDAAILTFGFDTGVRTSELAAIVIGDVDLNRGTVHIRHGKGGKERVATFGPTTTSVVRRYLDHDHSDPLDAGAPLFEGRNGRHFGRTGIYGLVKKRAEEAGVEGRKGLHRLRHSCATQHLLHGGNARTAQEQLGHADMEMTRRYTSALEVEDRRRQWRETSPVERTMQRFATDRHVPATTEERP